MQREAVQLYDAPLLYDTIVPPGPCEAFYRGLAARTGGAILELACGTGRLAIPLALDGYEVVGVDSSPAMLHAAKVKAAEAGVEVRFLEGDMRSLDLGMRFPLVILSCNSLSHLTSNDDLVGALAAISRHLTPGGLLAFDIVNPRIADLARTDRVSVSLGSSAPSLPVMTEQLLAYDPVQQIRVLRWQVGAQSAECRFTAPMQLRTIFPQELPLLLSAAGLELAARYGGFAGEPFTGESLNQVCIARQPSKTCGEVGSAVEAASLT